MDQKLDDNSFQTKDFEIKTTKTSNIDFDHHFQNIRIVHFS